MFKGPETGLEHVLNTRSVFDHMQCPKRINYDKNLHLLRFFLI